MVHCAFALALALHVAPRRLVSKRVASVVSRLRRASTRADQQAFTTLPEPRLDYRSIAHNVELKTANAANRKAPIPPDSVATIALLYRDYTASSKTLNSRRNARSIVSDEIKKQSGDHSTKRKAIEDAKVLKAEISRLELETAELKDRLLTLALAVPNDTHADVCVGPESSAKTLSTHGPECLAASPQRDHVSIGKQLGLLDLESASTATGSSWYYLLNEGALLELALTNYALSMAIAHGFVPVTTPDVVRADIASRCGFQPRDHPDSSVSQAYHIQTPPSSPELLLSGTAEIPLAAMFANKIYPQTSLPQKVVGLGRAFRAEAGARGADTRGLYRVHQFSKVELFAVTSVESSEQMMEDMRQTQTAIYDGLGLPFRVLDMPTEELGASAYRKFDMEAWMPGRGSWGEISSLSNCTDYQSRRLHIRYRPSTSATESSESETSPSSLPFAHTLNGTAAAIPRLIVALIENGAQFDADCKPVGLVLPSVLRPYWLDPENKRGIIHWS
ncbi:hypothetical protein HGRIS_008175 [Hohenbuehelia grisea]|uniref:serine--tRNA ligase n=1 Tax=Hohenbuehelia grisea TaxID=104357 RepID=A0ABR3J7P4_9AGAR